MRGNSSWSYTPYKPFLFDSGDIYICRIAPYTKSFHFEWVSIGDVEYEVYYRRRDKGEYILAGKTKETKFDVENLEDEREYEFYVQAGDKKSRVRLVATGEPIGITINYHHPDDDAYSFSGHCLCSPFLVRHPNGDLIASMDLYDGGEPQNLTLLYRSGDDGKNWEYLCDLFPCYWSTLFIHKDKLYVISESTEYGDLLIGYSEDGGRSFQTPSVLLRGSCSNKKAGVQKTPQNIIRHKGRIYIELEWGAWAEGYHAMMVMSCDENDDLTLAENWTFSEPLKYDENWEGVPKGPSTGCIEGTLVVDKNDKLKIIARYDMTKIPPYIGYALCYDVDTENPDAPLKFSHPVEFYGHHSKFMILQDEKTGKYYSIINRITDPKQNCVRNLLSLVVSDDLEKWTVVCDLIDKREKDPRYWGFQYVSFIIEGDDILYQCRAAFNGARTFHDSNYSIFQRIKDFRTNPVQLY